MYVIKNRVTGEYDQRGAYSDFHIMSRSSWEKLVHAKNHVICKLEGTINRFNTKVDNKVFEWYMNADYIEYNERGEIIDSIPVGDHLKNYFASCRRNVHLTIGQINRLKAWGELNESN